MSVHLTRVLLAEFTLNQDFRPFSLTHKYLCWVCNTRNLLQESLLYRYTKDKQYKYVRFCGETCMNIWILQHMSDYTKLTYEEAKVYIEKSHYEYLRECEFCDKEAEFENLIWYIDETIKYDITLICGFCNEACFNCWVLKWG